LASRWERLAVEAHYRHALDFSAKGGPYRLLQEEIIFDRIEDELASEVMGLAHSWHASASASDPWDMEGKTFEFHRKAANRIYRDVGKLKLPWYKRWTLDDADVLVGLIKQFYAQERDPKFREWRDKVKKEMNDKIVQIEQEQKALREINAGMKKAQAEREKKAKEANERRKERAVRPARSASR
jgi:hypothetical protein